MGFERLFSPLTIRSVTFRNRVLSTGHQTFLARQGQITDELIAYHRARAAGGAGAIIVESARFHDTAFSDLPEIHATTDDCIDGYRSLAEAVQGEGARIIGQLSHSGRCSARRHDGMRGVVYAPSAVPENRFHTMPREMPTEMVADIIASCGAAAARMAAAGLDGVELLASHGLLFAQFLNPQANLRQDRYGGSFENRLRPLAEALEVARAAMGPDRLVGLRISAEELEPGGLEQADVATLVRALADRGLIDYVNTTAGSMAGLGGSIHVVPPMEIAHGYLVPQAAALKKASGLPVFVAGRINQPQEAERILVAGQVDMCGMTRALISDPQMPAKSQAGQLDEIRACVACNQACIAHMLNGCAISCIQHPETGRELQYGPRKRVETPCKVMVVGGGPAGMKAAAVAAEAGHHVTLYEATASLGGQVKLAQSLPGRAEFGGLTINLTREMDRAGVTLRLNTRVTADLIAREAPDKIVLATGATPYSPEIEGADEAHVVSAWQVLQGEANVGSRAIIADWRCDWIGLGLAEYLAREGCHVRLAVNGMVAGQSLPQYTRDKWLGDLHRLGVEIIPHMRLHGIDADSAYFQHTLSGDPVILSAVDTLVTSLGHKAETALEHELRDWAGAVHVIGDCLCPRTAEEAILEGLKIGSAL